MQNAKATVTYYVLDRDGRTKERIVLSGVSWHSKAVSRVTGKGILFSQVIRCRMPVKSVPVGFSPRRNDMIVEGLCEADEISEAELKHSYHAAIVKAVTDNRRGYAPHWKVEAV